MDFTLPELGEGVYEAELVDWLVRPGDAVKRGQNLMEVLTDKATMEVPAPFAGTIETLSAEPGQTIKVGQTVLAYQPAGGQAAETSGERRRGGASVASGESSAKAVSATPVGARGRAAVAVRGNGPAGGVPVKAAPSVRLMARQLGIDIAGVQGSGPEGRILVEDLSRQVQPAEEAERSRTELIPFYGRAASEHGTAGTRIKYQGLRRKVGEHMVLAKGTIPHYTYVDECEVTDLVRLRESLRETFEKAGTHLTYLAFFVKAVVEALKEVPLVNASLDLQAGEIVLHDRYHIGIAVAAPGGLIVPVVHDADRLTFGELVREVDRLSREARSGKARREDLQGGTFTITSFGNIGGLLATPIIHHPEAAILGIGKIVRRPVFDQAGQVRPADMVYLSLSCDHRVLDGALAADFTNVLIRRLHNPAPLVVAK
jgi:pyruvate dehydrogenase E2 component (dihydrolipoamide acetyltransferase)/2-oxoisovalerate dehydrogenase E2 component (dihydrolipoyl transacylase)